MKGKHLYTISSSSFCGLGKEVNQDSVCSYEKENACIAILCDGTGGGINSEQAAKYTCERLKIWFEHCDDSASPGEVAEYLQEELRNINMDIYTKASLMNGRSYQSTTVSVICLLRDQAVILWIGNSRVYLIRRDIFTQISIDHTICDKSQLSNAALASSLGRNEDIPQIGVKVMPLNVGDCLLIVSDGISDVLDEAKISCNLKQGVNSLIEAATSSPNFDDCSAVYIQVSAS